MREDLKMGTIWKSNEVLGEGRHGVWGAQLGGVEFRKGLMGTMIAGMSPRSRTGGGRDLA